MGGPTVRFANTRRSRASHFTLPRRRGHGSLHRPLGVTYPNADEPQPKGGAWPLADETHRTRLTHSLAFGALNLVSEFSATFGANFMMQALTLLAYIRQPAWRETVIFPRDVEIFSRNPGGSRAHHSGAPRATMDLGVLMQALATTLSPELCTDSLCECGCVRSGLAVVVRW